MDDMHLTTAFMYMPFIKQNNKYYLINDDCTTGVQMDNFKLQLIDDLKDTIKNKTSLITPDEKRTYESMVEVYCDELKKFIDYPRHIDFWMETLPPKNLIIKNFYRNLYAYYDNKIHTYQALSHIYHKNSTYLLPKFFNIELDNTFYDNQEETDLNLFNKFFNLIIDKLESIDKNTLLSKQFWVIKDALSSVGKSIYGIQLFFDNDLQLIKYKIRRNLYKQFMEDQIERKTSIVNLIRHGFGRIEGGMRVRADWYLNEFVDSIRTPIEKPLNYNFVSTDIWKTHLSNRRLKIRAFFIPITEFSHTDFQKQVYAWVCPYYDMDIFVNEAKDIQKIISNRQDFISNITTGVFDENISKAINDDDKTQAFFESYTNLLNIIFDSKQTNGSKIVFNKIKSLCVDLINPIFQYGCMNNPNYYNDNMKNYIKQYKLNLKCFNVYAMDIIVTDNLDVYFLEINSSPMTGILYDIIYGALYDLAINEKQDALTDPLYVDNIIHENVIIGTDESCQPILQKIKSESAKIIKTLIELNKLPETNTTKIGIVQHVDLLVKTIYDTISSYGNMCFNVINPLKLIIDKHYKDISFVHQLPIDGQYNYYKKLFYKLTLLIIKKMK